eukprot:c20838_g2_i4 orf=109-831(+)
MGGVVQVVAFDGILSFLWVLCNAILRAFTDAVTASLGIHGFTEQAIKRAGVVGLLFLFYWLGNAMGGAVYNPLTAVAFTVTSRSPKSPPLYTLAVRLPAQVVGAIGAAVAATVIIPDSYKHTLKGPFLQVGPHLGALVEGLLSFAVVFINLLARYKGPKSGIRRTWITSISRVSISILGTGYTGPAMNPANASGWAFLRNQYNTWEHVYVYWFAPVIATLAAVWTIHFIPEPKKMKQKLS